MPSLRTRAKRKAKRQFEMSLLSLSDAMSERVLLCDGANGTQLKLRGLGFEKGCEHWNADKPESILQIHEAYVAAGCELVTTNTFCGSRIALARHGLEKHSRDFNLEGARLARQAAGPERWVLGDLGPRAAFLGQSVQQVSESLEADFREQAATLLEGGADAILAETMSDPLEAALAVRSARAAGALCVLVSFTFRRTTQGFSTYVGADVRTALSEALREGPDAVGANCGTALSPDDYVSLCAELSSHAEGKPIFVRPNAGAPAPGTRSAKRPYGPEAFAQAAPLWIAAGARILGGCCGTTAAHIAALRKAIDVAAASGNPSRKT